MNGRKKRKIMIKDLWLERKTSPTIDTEQIPLTGVLLPVTHSIHDSNKYTLLL